MSEPYLCLHCNQWHTNGPDCFAPTPDSPGALLPCPFCGGHSLNEVPIRHIAENGDVCTSCTVLKCGKCNAQGPNTAHRPGLFNLWNTRALPPPQSAASGQAELVGTETKAGGASVEASAFDEAIAAGRMDWIEKSEWIEHTLGKLTPVYIYLDANVPTTCYRATDVRAILGQDPTGTAAPSDATQSPTQAAPSSQTAGERKLCRDWECPEAVVSHYNDRKNCLNYVPPANPPAHRGEPTRYDITQTRTGRIMAEQPNGAYVLREDYLRLQKSIDNPRGEPSREAVEWLKAMHRSAEIVTGGMQDAVPIFWQEQGRFSAELLRFIQATKGNTPCKHTGKVNGRCVKCGERILE